MWASIYETSLETLFYFFGSITMCLFLYYYVLIHDIVFYYHSLETHFFSNYRKKGNRSRCEGMWGSTGERRQRENHTLDTLCEGNIFNIKGNIFMKAIHLINVVCF